MLVSQRFSDAKSTITRVIRGKIGADFLGTLLLPKGLPLLLGVVLGVLLALFIVNEQWPFVFGVLLLVPALILFNTYPFAALIIWLLVNPFLQTTPNTMYRMMYWMMHRGLIPLALVATILGDLLVDKRRQPKRLGRADLATVGFVGLVMVSIFLLQPDPMFVLYEFYDHFFIPICLYWFIRLTTPEEKDLKRLLPVALVIALIESVAGILSWFAPQLLPDDWLTYQGARTTGSLGFPHAYSITLVFFGFLLFQAAMQQKSTRTRTILLSAFGLSVLGVFLSFSRGSWLGGLAAAAGLLIMYPKSMFRMTIILVTLMIVLGSGVLSEQISFAYERLQSEDTANDRWVLWNVGYQMTQARPFFGWGYGNYNRYDYQFQTRTKNHVVSNDHASHNTFLSLSAELGLIGIFLYIFPLVWWLICTPKALPKMPKQGFWNRSLLIVLWLVMLGQAVVILFSDMRTSSYGMSLWWVTLGLIANLIRPHLKPGRIESREYAH